MPSCLRAFVIVAVAGAAAAAVGATTLVLAQPAGPSPILLEQRQRELVLVRHLREHVGDPGDGLALAADRRDLQRLRAGTAVVVGPSLSPTASDDELVDALRVMADLWYVRLVDRVPFGLMPRERLAGLARVQQAIGQLQSRGGRNGLDAWLPDVQRELLALHRAASGQGDVSDAAIDVALRVADAAATGRPVIGPLPYGPGGPPPAGGPYPDATAPHPGSVPAPYPPGTPGPYPGGGAPPPPGGGPTPYTLPPGYDAYSGAAAAGAGGVAACQTLRTAAGVSQGVSDMVRAAECWTRTPTWPGWGLQALEALDWAASLAGAGRDCAALDAAIDSLRDLGPRLAAAGLTPEVTALAGRAEADRRRLRAQSLCR